MENEKYNGWTNYETWAVALWIDNEELSYQKWREAAADAKREAPTCEQVSSGIWPAENAARYLLADWLKDEITEDGPLEEASVYTDLLDAALSEVNWQEIAHHLLADLEEPRT